MKGLFLSIFPFFLRCNKYARNHKSPKAFILMVCARYSSVWKTIFKVTAIVCKKTLNPSLPLFYERNWVLHLITKAGNVLTSYVLTYMRVFDFSFQLRNVQSANINIKNKRRYTYFPIWEINLFRKKYFKWQRLWISFC